MTEVPPSPPAAGPERRRAGRAPLLHGRSLSNGLIITLLVAGPTLLVEASWHGAPLYRTTQGQVALVLAAAGFFVGGAVAGQHRRRVSGALLQGLALAGLSLAVLSVAAVFRLAVLRAGVPHGSTVAWTLLGAVVLTVVACAGGLTGRALYLRSRKRNRA